MNKNSGSSRHWPANATGKRLAGSLSRRSEKGPEQLATQQRARSNQRRWRRRTPEGQPGSSSPTHGERLGGGDARSVLRRQGDRKSTRLNSSHLGISYAVF